MPKQIMTISIMRKVLCWNILCVMIVMTNDVMPNYIMPKIFMQRDSEPIKRLIRYQLTGYSTKTRLDYIF
jgi:hypothetical protein